MKISFIQQAKGDTVVSGGFYINYSFQWWHLIVLLVLIVLLRYIFKKGNR